MTEIDTSTPATARDMPRPRRSFTVWLTLLRVLAVLHAAFAIGQPLSIGQYLAGLYSWLGVHSAGAGLVELLGFGLAVVSVGYAVTGGRAWVPIACWVMVFAEIVQSGMGYARILAVHIPLGVFVVTCAVLLAIAACGRTTSRPRPRRNRAVTPAVPR